MEHKKIAIGVSLVLIIIAGVILFQRYFTLVGTTIFTFSSAIAIPLLIVSFLGSEIFKSLVNFAKWYLPLAGILIVWLIMSGSSGGWGMPNFFDPEMIALWTAVLFLVISIILIITKSIQLRGKK